MKFVPALALALCAGAANAQVVINEFITNPPGSGSIDNRWEFIELYGTPGMSLNGYAIGFASGGMDHDGDGFPSRDPLVGDPGDEFPEMDEVFHLDGLSIGANGFLVLYNTTSGGSTSILPLLPAATTRRAFPASHIPSSDVANRIKNDGSMTVLLVRNRPFYQWTGTQSLYDGQPGYFAGTRYAFRKDINPDVDFNSRFDRGVEIPKPPTVDAVQNLLALQIVDEVSWSNEGGKEYTTSEQFQISDTPGFNPDAMSRVAYYGFNPRRGHRFNGSGELVNTRIADEELIYGELLADGSDIVDPSLKYIAGTKGPTNVQAPRFDGSCNPDAGGACNPVTGGAYAFTDINVTGFGITPGTFNDVNSSGSGGINIVQFRFLPGDFNFDRKVDIEDLYLINQSVGATLNDTVLVTDNNGTTDPLDDFTYTGWKWQSRGFNGVVAMMNMNTTDGPGGANASSITPADVVAAEALIFQASN
jgi:hypothetical protein